MQYEEMQQKLHQYNWDDGFDLPWKIISDKNCDLAMALELFYLADGFGYFQTFIHNVGGTKEWFCFMATLYEKIVNGTYPKQIIPIKFHCLKCNGCVWQNIIYRLYF